MKNAIERGIVKTVVNGIQISRHGRGYSKIELLQTGITDIRIARSNKISIDPFRSTAYDENIERLKVFLNQETSKSSNLKQKRPKKNIRQET